MYNFEVENWHTYYIGAEKLLVHNAPCATKAVKEAAENIAKTWDDLAKYKHCFAEGTLVKIDNGYVPIETLKKGDLVACYNFENTEVVYSEVNEVYCNTAESLLKIYIDDEVIECTQSHQFWSVTDKDWIIAKDLNEGDWLLSASGNNVQIKKMQFFEQQITTYNLEIESHHNYFVSSLDILVHNGNPFPNSIFNDLTTRYTEIYKYFEVGPPPKDLYVGKTVQGLEKRASQHATEKGLQKLLKDGIIDKVVIDKGYWTPFQTAAQEQHYISSLKTKGRKGSALIWNKINALSGKKFDYFSKLIACGKSI